MKALIIFCVLALQAAAGITAQETLTLRLSDRPVREVADSVERIAQLEAASGVKAPVRLSALKGKKVRFDAVTEKDQMECVVLNFLK